MLDVLLVDDSPVIRKMLRRVLKEAGLELGEIFEAADGAQALVVLESNHIDLMLSDVNMPIMDGIELLEKVRARPEWNAMPILMVTTEGGAESVQKAVQMGANGYIRKPFTPDEVKQKVTKCLMKVA